MGTVVYIVCIHKRLCMQAGSVPFKGTFGDFIIMLLVVTSHITLCCAVWLEGKIFVIVNSLNEKKKS